jgi:hypothetical protein
VDEEKPMAVIQHKGVKLRRIARANRYGRGLQLCSDRSVVLRCAKIEVDQLIGVPGRRLFTLASELHEATTGRVGTPLSANSIPRIVFILPSIFNIT